MKKIAVFLCLLGFLTAFAQQQQTVSIDWNDKTAYSNGDIIANIPQFDSDSFNYDPVNKRIYYTLKFPVQGLVDESSIQITNISYESIEESKLGSLSRSAVPTSVKAKIENYIARDQYFALLTFFPIIKEGNSYRKVKSLTYSYTNAPSQRNNLQNNVAAIGSSVLATGAWYRFYVEKSGVYRLSKAFLNELGLNTDGVDAKRIKIYGNGGRMVPLRNSTPYPMDLEENAIQVVGENDNVFDAGDYILFYAEGVDNWSDENETHLNLYSDRAYYYVTTTGGLGKRIAPFAEPTTASTLALSDFDDYQFHEVDLTNLGRLGRVWFGEGFNLENEQEFQFSFPNIVPSATTSIKMRVGGNSFVPTKFSVTVNSQPLPNLNLSAVVLNSGTLVRRESYPDNTIIATSPNYTVKLTFDDGGVPTSKGHLDYIAIKTKSKLTGYGKQFRFQYNNTTAELGTVAQYQFSNASGITQVWDITDIYNVSSIANNNTSNFSFKAILDSKKYIAIDPNDFLLPAKEQQSRVANQDIKGTIFNDNNGNQTDIDYLIVTPSFLLPQAEKLANFHRNNSGMQVRVLTLESIYQEFSSGKQDIGAIRNMVKYVYQNASTPSKRVKYLNLFGDASYDFKSRTTNNNNIVPIYHAIDSYTSGVYSFASDDFFAYMDANEGNVFHDSPYGADVATGRMIVTTPQQAEEMVNKVIQYNDLKSYGSWRNNFVSISDDTDKPGDQVLQASQNLLTDELATQNPFVNTRKILLDAYQQESSAGGDRYPKAKEDIQNAFEKGALIFNYLGHGGEDGLTAERIWDKLDGLSYFNEYRYPLFITITCEFSRFDNPLRPTAGEYTYLNPKGGAIAMITTTRSIGYAFQFNKDITKNMYSLGIQPYKSMAEVLRVSKAQSGNNSDTKVALFIGDPAQMLAIPRQKVVLTKINNIPITQPVPDLQALAFVKLSGEVQDEAGNLMSNYTGELAVNVFDKQYTKTTFNNDGYSPPITFNNLGETIFRGNASINGGEFEVGFVVPRDIKIPLGNGRVSFYAKRNEIFLDKTGYNTDIKIGGINTAAVADVTAPKVRLYMNDESFVNGGITNESPYFLAFLEDEHGINTASGIGHDIVAILDGDETNPYVLNDYYETELNDFTKGKIRFPFRNLALGLHTITFKAWDVYNNFISAEIQFVVVGDESVTLSNVLNYPNPFVNYTQFWFSHNRPFEPLDVQVQIITITGKIVKTINQNVLTDGFLSREISWDGRDDFGDRIGKGVYIYKLTVRSTLSGEKSEKIEKLVIL